MNPEDGMLLKGKMLLTGGSGMVGRNILEHSSASEWKIMAPPSSTLDLLNEAETFEYLSRIQPDIVVHCAGKVGGIQANLASPVAFLEKNMAIGRNIILAARAAGVSRFINLASTCIYPREAENPLCEDTLLTGPLEPTNEGYALAKIVALRLCQYINREDASARYKTLIPCNIYGRHDHFDPSVSHLLPSILHKLHAAKTQSLDEVEIWGDGKARREFMYAGDLADAVLRAAADIDCIPDLMNIGLGQDFTVNEYYEAAAKIVGWSGRFIHDLSKPVGMQQKLACDTRQTTWGWAPRVSLTEGITKTYDYFLKEVEP